MLRFFASLLLLVVSICASAQTSTRSDYTFYRNPQTALQGTANGAAFAYPGSALTASSVRFHADLGLRPIKKALWVLVWNPNTTSGYTAVRLVTADNGPANLVEIARISNNNYTSPKVDAVDITADLNALIAAGRFKQILQQTAGNGANGALIYASWIEIVWE